MRILAAVILVLLTGCLRTQELPPPIIDMHVHALRVKEFAALGGPPPIPHCVPMTDYPVPETGRQWSEILRSRDLPCRAIWSPITDEEVMQKTLAIMERRNMFGVASGPHVARYRESAPTRIIPSLSHFHELSRRAAKYTLKARLKWLGDMHAPQPLCCANRA